MPLKRHHRHFEGDVEKLAVSNRLDRTIRSVLSAFAKMVGEEIDYIEKNIDAANPTQTTATLTNITVNYLGSGTAVVGAHRSQEATLVAGSSSQRVSFLGPVSTPYFLWWRTYNVSGEQVGVQISEASMDANGFTVTDCVENCTIKYGAIPFQ